MRCGLVCDPHIYFSELNNTFNTFAHFSQGYAFLKDIKAEDERNLKKFIKVSKEEEKVEEAKNKLKAIKRASREETKGKWRRQRTS